jgi:pyruvate-ferredoxin/flavodoxin oxidoreductase
VPEWPVGKLHPVRTVRVCLPACLHPSGFGKGRRKSKSAVFVQSIKAIGKGMEGYEFPHSGFPLRLHGCSSCAQVCPAKNKALIMKPSIPSCMKAENWDYAMQLKQKDLGLDKFSVKKQPV